jgi:6-phosphogluconolactonase
MMVTFVNYKKNKMKSNIKIFDTPTELAQNFAEYFSLLSKQKLLEKNIFTVALSGGTTPSLFFQYVSQIKDIDWSNIFIFWSDERCVPPIHTESNYGLAFNTLIKNISIPELNIFRIKGEENPTNEVIRYSKILKEKLKNKNKIPQFELIILGMGEDGHTASIFPNQINEFNSNDYCFVASHPATGQKRVSLTGTIINNAKEIALLVTGEKKAKVLSEIVLKQGDYKKYPISSINRQTTILYWWIDKSAALYL